MGPSSEPDRPMGRANLLQFTLDAACMKRHRAGQLDALQCFIVSAVVIMCTVIS